MVTNERRLPELPEIPTLAELGIDGFPPLTWTGVVAPPGTPDAIVSQLNVAANEVLKSIELMASLAKIGFTVRTGSPQDFAELIAPDLKQWSAVVKATNVMPVVEN